MATIRLKPSVATRSNTSYLSISNESNIWDNNTSTYATLNHTRNNTTAYYLYLGGFDFSSIPSDAEITDAKITVIASVTSASTSQKPALYNNTTALSLGTFSTNIGTSTTTSTLTLTENNFNTFKNYGSNARVRLYLNRSNRNTASSMKIYEVYIDVTYTQTIKYNITTTLTGEGTIYPSGTIVVDEGSNQTIMVIPDNDSANISGTDNGSPITFVHQSGSSETVTSVIKTYAKEASLSNETAVSNAINKGYDTTSTTTQNAYSSSSGVVTTVTYGFDLSAVPSGATITNVRCRVKGHAESSSNSNEHCDCQLYAGSTAKGSMKSFKSTGTTTTVLDLDTGNWTADEIQELTLQVKIGYYGGGIDGATVEVTYEIADSYVYTITNISSNHNIAVVIRASGAVLSIKQNGTWVNVSKVYMKINGV